jgi:2-amino-4-hydroxy-6-hydroxymethyldihydropteridine diphosphokinase
MNSVYLLIGGNMGDRFNYLRQAKDAIGKNAGKILETSAIYETEAWGLTNQDKFLNQALKIDTQLNPKDLLHCLLQIEESLGRKREVKYGPRIIDIEILF